MANYLEMWLSNKMFNIASSARKEVIDADHSRTRDKQRLAQK